MGKYDPNMHSMTSAITGIVKCWRKLLCETELEISMQNELSNSFSFIFYLYFFVTRFSDSLERKKKKKTGEVMMHSKLEEPILKFSI